MSSRLQSAVRFLLASATLIVSGIVSTAEAADGNRINAGAEVYQDQSGSTWFALSVDADFSANTGPIRDHIVLLDTSASQKGDHRAHSLKVAESLVREFGSDHRVALFAVDVTATDLTGGFVAPNGNRIDEAFGRLHQRAPLGATNLKRALETASAAAPTDRPVSILYIGDGMSIGGLVDGDTLSQLVTDLRNRRHAVSAYAVGPRTDLELLGVLAQHTGGIVEFDRGSEITRDADQLARSLATAMSVPVAYPDSITVAQPDVELIPKTALPLRPDRETVYLGRTTSARNPSDVLVSGRISAGRQSASFAVKTPKTPVNAYVRSLFERADNTGGFAVSLVGNEFLGLARADFQQRIDQLVDMTDKAFATGDFDRAEQLAATVRDLDTGNVHAAAIMREANKRRVQTVAQVTPDDQVIPDVAGDISSANDTLGPPVPGGRDRIAEQEQLRAVKLGKLRLEVTQSIDVARQMQREEPDAAVSLLKEVLETVNSVSNIDPDGRRELQKRVQAALEDVQSQNELLEQQRVRLAERVSAQEQQRNLLSALQLEEEELDRLTDMIRGLLEDARHGDDDAFEEAEAVARVAVDLKPGNGTAAAALFNSEAAGQLSKAFRLRSLRADQYLATLYQVELSHVPFPDEPPIRWPDAGHWRELSVRRQKWASVDLKQDSPTARLIMSELDKPIEQMDFVDDPLTTVIEFIEQVHGFQIEPDKPALADEGIELDNVFVQVNLSGITLRSALRIILEGIEDAELDYTIRNEVMYITTAAAMEDPENLQTRVYPVGDLVIPPQQLGGGGGLGGGLGGQQGGGQFGGGQQGGGQFGGGGGGFFSIAPEKLLMPAAQNAPAAEPASERRRPARKAQPRAARADEVRPQAKTPTVRKRSTFSLTNESIENLKKKRVDQR